jgi:hypothetical protein
MRLQGPRQTASARAHRNATYSARHTLTCADRGTGHTLTCADRGTGHALACVDARAERGAERIGRRRAAFGQG